LQTLIAHVFAPPVPLDQLRADVPPDLQVAVLCCLEKNPAQRFPDARSLDAALAGCHAAGLWTEERAAAWWHGQTDSANGANSVADATTREAEPTVPPERGRQVALSDCDAHPGGPGR
jgi:hypothetical protein